MTLEPFYTRHNTPNPPKDQFYVVYDPQTHLYLNDDRGEFVPFTQATHYRKYHCAELMRHGYDGKVVGPYNEGDSE